MKFVDLYKYITTSVDDFEKVCKIQRICLRLDDIFEEVDELVDELQQTINSKER